MNHGDSPKCGYEYGVNAKGRAYCKGCKQVFPPAPLQGRIVRYTTNALKSIYGIGGLGAPINGRYVGDGMSPGTTIVQWSDGRVGPVLKSNIELDPTAAGIVVKGRSSGATCFGCGSGLPKDWNPKGHGAAFCSKDCETHYNKRKDAPAAHIKSHFVFAHVGDKKGKSTGGSGPVVIQRVGKHGGFEVSRFDGAAERRKVVQQYGAAVVLARKESEVAGVPIVDRVVGRSAGKKGMARGESADPKVYLSSSEGRYRIIQGGVPISPDKRSAEEALAIAKSFNLKVSDRMWDGDAGEWRKLEMFDRKWDSVAGEWRQGSRARSGGTQGFVKGAAKGLAHGYGKSACIVCLRAMAPRKDGKPYHAKCERIYKSNPRFYEMSPSRPAGHAASKKIVVEAAYSQEQLENDGAAATCECETLAEAKRKANFYTSKEGARYHEMDAPLGYARVLVDGENVFDVEALS